MRRYILALSLLITVSPATYAGEIDGEAVLGGAIGGAAGTALGSAVGGREGAILGGALGAGVGAAVGSSDDGHRRYAEPPRYYKKSYRRGPPYGNAYGHRKHRHRDD